MPNLIQYNWKRYKKKTHPLQEGIKSLFLAICSYHSSTSNLNILPLFLFLSTPVRKQDRVSKIKFAALGQNHLKKKNQESWFLLRLSQKRNLHGGASPAWWQGDRWNFFKITSISMSTWRLIQQLFSKYLGCSRHLLGTTEMAWKIPISRSWPFGRGDRQWTSKEIIWCQVSRDAMKKNKGVKAWKLEDTCSLEGKLWQT